MVTLENSVVGFIGLGVMGKRMAGHLLDAGYPLVVNTRTMAKAEELLDKSAKWAETVKEVAEQATVIITMVGSPSEVEDVYFGENGLIQNGKIGSSFVDMSTSSPSLAVKIYEEAKKKGIQVLDAPVSGGDVGAREAKLSIMVGGEEEAFAALRPLLGHFGTNIVYQGKAGAGQHTKMCNQIAVASNMIGVCEAIIYAEKAGLNPETVLKSISSGAAGSWSLSNLVPRILQGDFDPGFYIKHFIKDMNIALEEAGQLEMEAPGLALAKSLYEQLAKRGEEYSGTQALYKYWKD